tara:strand:+ start:1570 stop:1986 length:417 start_codon:yes stop_codon:yes gene_type:complete
MVSQITVQLPVFSRGFHLVSEYIMRELPKLTGVVHVFIKHTSAALTINENADPSVRIDFETFFNRLVPEDRNMFLHIDEGTDDMTSHIKSSLLGNNISFPIKEGEPQLGIWQGIYLCEFRNAASKRSIEITVIGEENI